ncbi:MAG TPA: GntR family transcriptional regulator, partial [Clostridia bacterium]|nr:GntR family transcriptional regulator [Clostridia bacterium]
MHDITLQFDTKSDIPLYEQLYRFISMDIMCGRLKGGARLPSRRSLSRHLGISEQTVNTAYELLKAEGFLRSEERRGVFV